MNQKHEAVFVNWAQANMEWRCFIIRQREDEWQWWMNLYIALLIVCTHSTGLALRGWEWWRVHHYQVLKACPPTLRPSSSHLSSPILHLDLGSLPGLFMFSKSSRRWSDTCRECWGLGRPCVRPRLCLTSISEHMFTHLADFHRHFPLTQLSVLSRVWMWRHWPGQSPTAPDSGLIHSFNRCQKCEG